MVLDWNWFFSSLSQSAAAIVGIFGAFIITKIFSNQTVFREKNTKLRDLLVQAKKISDSANSYNIGWYNECYNRDEYDEFSDFLEEFYGNEESVSKVTEDVLSDFVGERKFSPYSDMEGVRERLMVIARKFCEANVEKREKREAAAEAYARSKKDINPQRSILGIPNSLGARYFTTPEPRPADFVPRVPLPVVEMNKVRDGFKQSFLDAKHHSRLAAEFLASIKGNPESPKQITYALALVLFIFFIGVIYPLSFLPAAGEPKLGFSLAIFYYNVFSFKGYLLEVVSIAFSIIVGLFFNTHAKMKYPPADVDKIKGLTLPESYCSTFKVMVDR